LGSWYVLKKDWHLLHLARVKREKRLPAVLFREEVKKFLAGVTTFHNYVYPMTVYTCGLHLQEGLFLEVSDIDGAKKMIHSHQGKGAKDRSVPLPEFTYALLRRYWATYRNPRHIFRAIGRGHNKKRGVSVHTLQQQLRQSSSMGVPASEPAIRGVLRCMGV